MKIRLRNIENWDELADQAKWSVARLAKQCGVSPRTIERYFLEHKRKSPKVWLNEKRQQNAVELLRKGYSVKETADRLRYRWESTFSREFTKYWGFSPVRAKDADVAAAFE